MEYPVKSVSDAKVKGKRVFVRCDFDVPLKNGKIEDDSRLLSGIETIKFLIAEGATVIAAGHLGRPEGEDKKLSTEPVARWFTHKFLDTSFKKTELDDFKAFKLDDNFYILENLRFDTKEEENDSEYSEKLANLADIYVNEAFSVSHREHASIVGIPKFLPRFAGFHLAREIKVLSKILNDPKRPLTIIIGGAKIETKLPLISNMHKFADFVLVGGELAEQTKVIATEQHKKITGQKAMLLAADLTENKFDITLNSTENFGEIINMSRTVVWNGPMGFFEEGYTEASEKLAEYIIKADAYKVVGGGDTISFLSSKKLLNNFDFVSVGGGAMLEFLAGVKLPGLQALEN